ncbi:1-phosphatidylinositol 4,5-bisphosphate phosphodiesterase eta-2-like isoform X2 [Coregonus clupeaformis]|uniref:1-phosphatidylinositol 4,5-bisphosphate phosphodiesterase eta-2-like isoform X2 n=1 Tax=Coregonus clupeaformis TaxID=59861 RepID=UPI001E1C416B|nr:1-phosphatidylinositol 4,5-bisphosphate phosphodiesterase eta-2-like isoform X2 [Coregonus clupeaformis]
MSASVMTSGLFPMSFPVSSALMRSAVAAQEPCPTMDQAPIQRGEKERVVCKSQQQASLSRLVEQFFWIGSSILSFSKWRLGDMVEKCMSSMQTGTQMVKLRGGSRGLVRYFYLDQHKSCIRWRPSRKNEKAKISIDSIREVCEGKQSEIFQRYSEGSFDPNCCFSLYYGERLESLDLVSSTGEEARTWITGLKYLVAGISDEDSLAKRQRTRDQWLKQTFTEADKNGDGSLSISEVLQLLHKLNVNLPRQKVKQMFKEADTDDNQGTLGFEEFCSFYKMMSTRHDLYLLMLTYSNHMDHLDTSNLARFLELDQKMTKVTKDHCLEIVNRFEPCPENQKQGVLGIDGFTSYMRSPVGDIFNPEHNVVTQDMSQPLCNYFIASSHNTYLMGDQLMSQSRLDMYAWVLQAGCRCVEVDCWDGQDGEPIVHHGYTLTSKILFKDVIETINKYAFVKNNYPVILSIENHCSVPQQKKMAQYLVEVMGDKLDLSAIKADEQGRLPSPDTLKGKILIKGKKLPSNIDEDNEEGDVTDEDSADEMEDDCKLINGDTSMTRKQVENVAKKKLDNLMKESKIRDQEDPDSFTIAAQPPSGKTTDKSPSKGDEANPSTNKRLGRTFMGSFSKRKKKAVKLKKTNSLEDTDTDQESTSSASRAPLHHSSRKKTMKLTRALSDLVKYTKSVGVSDIEKQASSSWLVSSLSETKAHQIMQQKAATFIHFNQRQLSRIYPSSYRVDSSNFNPQPFWNAGCHLVALNYQSEGRVLQLNRAKFSSNGNCGYILKPASMCEGAFNPMIEDPFPGQVKKQLVLKIISGQQLPKPKDSMLGDRGEIIDPFVEVEIIGIPVDCCKEQTRVVDDNGFNPMWEETLVFMLHMPQLALVRFLVWDHDPIGQDFIGQRTIAFNSMIPGYRHVYLEGMEAASIFVHVSVHDVTGKGKVASGIKGLFHRNPKQASLDSHAAAQLSHKQPFGAHLLRRTASAPTKVQPKVKKGFPEIAIDTKDYRSEGTSEDRESEDRDLNASSQPPLLHQHNWDTTAGAAPTASRQGTNKHHGTNKAFHPNEGKDHSTVQRPAPPIRLLAPIADELGDRHLTHSSSTPADYSSTHNLTHSSSTPVDHSFIRHSPPPPLPTSTAITIFTLSPASKSEADSSVNGRGEEGPVNGRGEDGPVNGRGEEGPVNGRGEEGPVNGRGEEGPVNGRGEEGPVKGGDNNKRPPALHRTTSAPVVPTPGVGPDPKDLNPSQYSRDPRVDDGTSSPMEHAPSRAEAPYTHSEYTKDDAELKTEPSAESPVPLADPSVDSSPLEVQALRALFGGSPKNTPVRRTKSEGHVRAVAVGQQQSSAMPEVCTDATLNDRLWSKLEPKPGSHRDSVSSSSSISSNDTVIDLSLPNLARKTLTCLSSGPSLGDDIFPDPPSWVNRPRSAIASFDTPRVSKSKSNPNLLQGHLGEPEDELQPRPLGAPREPPVDSPSRITQRRHTWSRLYMEGLKQSSPPAKKPSAVAALAASATSPLDTGASMSKSLGDLTSDDIACNFDSKYRSISRSFSIRPSRNDPRRGYPNPQRPRLPSDLTEQLRRLTDVEPLTARDFAPQVQQGPLAEAQEEPPLRRTSSRSQSRVRYIAKRAKQAQERQRLQGLNQPHPATGAANTSISGGGSPMEERGNPEGACCVARSPCASLDLLSQLSPPGPPNRQSQTSLNSDNDEVFFMLQL